MSVWENWVAENPVPFESIYYWMYSAGLHACPENEVERILRAAGKQIRRKDWENYQRGFSRSFFTGTSNTNSLSIRVSTERRFTSYKLTDFPVCDSLSNYERRWVPCNANNKPILKWSERMVSYEEAEREGVYIAESLYMTPYIVFDIDGDHNNVIHPDLIRIFSQLLTRTHALTKQSFYDGVSTSFHLTFQTDRLIPTKHFTESCIDLLGNARPQLRYRKRKVWNGVFPVRLTEEVWDFFMAYIERMNYAKQHSYFDEFCR